MAQSSIRLKSRIKTSKNISQITRAMEMVSASKMRRAQTRATKGSPFSRELAITLLQLTRKINPELHPLLQTNPSGRSVFIVLSTDRGLAGSLNTAVFSFIEKHLKLQQIDNPLFITVGKRARDYFARTGREILASFTEMPDRPRAQDVSAISTLVTSLYPKDSWREVNVVYPDFVSTLVQKPKLVNLLPFGTPEIPDSVTSDWQAAADREYLFEPDANQVIDWLLPYYVENRLFQILLELKASEHSARMVSMKNAHDAADQIVSDLTLVYNQARQAKVTSELLDAYAARLTLSK